MIYQKLKRVWSHNDIRYIPKFEETFPELKHLSKEELCERFKKLEIDFYSENSEKRNSIIRITLPFAILLYVLMFMSLPIVYMIKGQWGYGFNKNNIIYNWFKQLGLQ